MSLELEVNRDQRSKPIAPGSGRARHGLGLRRFLVALLVGAACAVPAAPAFGEGSVDANLGPGSTTRNGLDQSESGYTVFRAYVRAGETIQMGSSAMGLGGASNIRVYAPGTSFESATNPNLIAPFGTDPVFDTEIFDCGTAAPGTGRIASRAEELAARLRAMCRAGSSLRPTASIRS